MWNVKIIYIFYSNCKTINILVNFTNYLLTALFPFRLTNRPCLMFLFFLATCFMFFLLLLLTSILSVQSLATPCPHTWTMYVSFSTQDSKRSPRVTYCGTRLFMINSSSKIEYRVCTIISSAFNNLLSTFTFTKEYV